jgi:hypothetical protein
MLTHSEAFWLQFSTIVVAVISPIIAVVITIWYQNRSAKRNAQMNLFMDLVSFRDYLHLPWQYFVALNRIDVVFHREDKIRQLWHEYYDLIQQPQTDHIVNLVQEKRVSLISQIAKHLGYHNIDQIFLQRYYQPMGNVNQYTTDWDLKAAAIKFFQQGNIFYQKLFDGELNQKQNEQ